MGKRPKSKFSLPPPHTPVSKPPGRGTVSFGDNIQLHNTSSPTKNADQKIDRRKDLEATHIVKNMYEDSEFVANHLSNPQTTNTRRKWWAKVGKELTLVGKIKIAGSNSARLSVALAELLNLYSKRLHDHVQDIQKFDEIVFLEHHNNAPTHSAYHARDRPDMVAVWGPKCNYDKMKIKGRTEYQGVPHYKVLSLVECKPNRDDGRAQVASYAYQLMESRPDVPGVYVMWARPSYYQILWSDAAGVVASKGISWNNLEPMASYVYSLYKPPQSHILLDATITPPTHFLAPEEPLRWSIEGPNNKIYDNCVSLFTGTPWGRRTNVWSYPGKGRPTDVVVIKDAYRDVKRRYKEEELLEAIHNNGIYPGVVLPLVPKEEMPCPDIRTAEPQTKSYERLVVREKMRLFMGSFGQQFRYAKTVKDILLATYDIVEVHRGMINDVKILHRDISSYNILMYPKHNPRARNGKGLVENPPMFIDQVLSGKKTRTRTDRSKGLLIDFDNSANTEPHAEEDAGELATRTGTPMFIARSVAAGRALDSPDTTSRYKHMPTLSDDAKKVYIRAYEEDVYEMYCDAPDTFHGSTPPDADARLPPFEFCHRPDHDVESIFWVLLATLLRAQPSEETKNVDLETFWEANESFEDHIIRKGASKDTRDCLFGYSITTMEIALDPKLAFLGQMLVRMAAQIRPEYGYLSPPPPKDHLHEAMRRLLLEQILEMGDSDVDLQPGVSRPSPPGDDDALKVGAKRKSDRQGGTNGKRSRLSPPQNRQERPQYQRT